MTVKAVPIFPDRAVLVLPIYLGNGIRHRAKRAFSLQVRAIAPSPLLLPAWGFRAASTSVPPPAPATSSNPHTLVGDGGRDRFGVSLWSAPQARRVSETLSSPLPQHASCSSLLKWTDKGAVFRLRCQKDACAASAEAKRNSNKRPDKSRHARSLAF